MSKMRKLLALALALTMVLSLAACGGSSASPAASEAPAESAAESKEESKEAEAPAESAAESSEEAPAEEPAAAPAEERGNIVYATATFGQKFSPFFATTAYDMEVVDLTQTLALAADRGGCCYYERHRRRNDQLQRNGLYLLRYGRLRRDTER